MPSCSHQYWLRVCDDQTPTGLEYTGQLHRISSILKDPARQSPCILYFIGNQFKGRVIRSLFPKAATSSGQNYGFANIDVQSSTVNDDHPVLIAESYPDFAQSSLRRVTSNCHETTRYPVAWLDNNGTCQERRADLANNVVASLFMLFIDVMCIFSQDCGGLDAVVDMIATWTGLKHHSSSSKGVRPRLLVVASVPGELFDTEALRFRLRVLTDHNFLQSFSSLSIVNVLGTGRRLVRDHYKGLSDTLRYEAQLMRTDRTNSHTLFSMIHTATLFDSALTQFAEAPQRPFDFVQYARSELPIPPGFPHHLKTFLMVCSEHSLPSAVIWEHVASTIFLDCYPPDMHLFNPSDVFRRLYERLCISGIRDYATTQELQIELICSEIEAHMISMFSLIKYGQQSAATLHRQHLARNQTLLSPLRSMDICLVCLQRKPEHSLECGHNICDNCVRVLGKSIRGLEHRYGLEACPRCEKVIWFQVKLLPPTCRVRFLSIDGGGSRGIISIAFMHELEQALDLPYAIQEHFDYCIGTSSGGVATIGLFGKHWTPKQCLQFFRQFATVVFPPKKPLRFSICVILKHIFAFYLSDGRYDAAILESSLKEAFGMDRLFDATGSRVSGMKFAVTATTISDATLCLLSNYNGKEILGMESGYKNLRVNNINEEISLWEAARCTTAAPTYFKPKHLGALGTFQDGGLKYNNPVRPGLREIRRIWGDIGCDVVLSIGTGYQKKLLSPVAANIRNLVQDGPFARVYRASMESLSLNGQLSWEDHWHGLDDNARKRHFRLNLPLTDQEPKIDDVHKMPYLLDQIRYNLGDIEGIARAFKAVSFFFELSEPPMFDRGQYACSGFILCRSPDSRALIQSIITSHPRAQFLLQDAYLGLLTLEDICQLCGRFQKRVDFRVRHPSSHVNLQLSFNRLFCRSISGFPHPMEWFIKRQKLNARFGLSSHKHRNVAPAEATCPCELERYRGSAPDRQGKRKRQGQKPTHAKKPRRR